jgi:hypothetical protein
MVYTGKAMVLILILTFGSDGCVEGEKQWNSQDVDTADNRHTR